MVEATIVPTERGCVCKGVAVLEGARTGGARYDDCGLHGNSVPWCLTEGQCGQYSYWRREYWDNCFPKVSEVDVTPLDPSSPCTGTCEYDRGGMFTCETDAGGRPTSATSSSGNSSLFSATHASCL